VAVYENETKDRHPRDGTALRKAVLVFIPAKLLRKRAVCWSQKGLTAPFLWRKCNFGGGRRNDLIVRCGDDFRAAESMKDRLG
jgi:hypothetical protein